MPGPAPSGAPAATLTPSPFDAPAPAAAAEAARASAAVAAASGHDHGGTYVHRDAGRVVEATPNGAAPGHEHHDTGEGHGGDAAGDSPGSAAAVIDHEDAVYTCPLHPAIRREAPGACPICGTTLERRGDGE